MSYQYRLLTFLLLLLSCPAWCQLQLREFIASALEDPEVMTFEDQITYLNGKPYRLAPVREVEFRSRNREMIQTQQEYSIRISPSNPWEMRRQNAYFREIKSTLGFEQSIALRDALIDRYYTAVEYIFLSDMRRLAIEGQAQLESQMQILEKQSGSRYFDAEDYVELKVDQLEFIVDAEEVNFELSQQFNRISRIYPKAHGQHAEWGFSQTISPAKIRMVIDSIERSFEKSMMVMYQEQRIKLAESRYLLEQANINLGYFQTSYDMRRYHQDRNPFSIAFGVTIPIFNPNKGDMARHKLDIIDAEYDLKEESYQSGSDRRIQKDKVLSNLLRAESIEDKIENLRKSTLAHTLSTIRGGDPLIIIQFNQQMNKLQRLSYKVKRELLLSYVDYLAAADALQRRPLINYFSPSLEPAN